MSFLTNAKELTGAREKIAQLESQVATLAAQAQSLATEASEVETEAAAILTARDAAVASVTILESALAAEKLAHESTKASVEKLASEKAQHTLASVGQPPVAAALKSDAGDILARIQSEKDPIKRTELYRKNIASIRTARNTLN